jgi:hypothetical protein
VGNDLHGEKLWKWEKIGGARDVTRRELGMSRGGILEGDFRKQEASRASPSESEIANRLKIRAKLSLIVAASSSCVSVPVLNSGGMVRAFWTNGEGSRPIRTCVFDFDKNEKIHSTTLIYRHCLSFNLQPENIY